MMQTETTFSNEESPLLAKALSACSSSLNTHYSQRTVATVSTSGSYEQLDQLDQLFIPPTPSHHPQQQECSPQAAPHRNNDKQQGEQGITGSFVIFEISRSDENESPGVKGDHMKQDDDEPVVDGTLVENVMESYQEVADAIYEELHEADDGDGMHFLEMGLTRNCSILPGDVVDAAAQQPPPPAPLPTDDDDDCEDVEAGRIENDEHSNKTTTMSAPLSAYLLLLGAVISLAAIGPLLELQSDVSPTMKIVWRQAGTGILLFPLAALEVYRTGFPSMTGPQWVTFLLSTISYDIFSTSFVLALSFTSVGNTVILSNSLALILLVGKLCVGDPVSLLEGAGAMVAFGGAALCSRDSADHNGSSSGLLGDAIAIFSAFGGVGYLIFAKSVRSHMSMYIFMFLTMTVGTLLLVIFQTLVLGEEVTLDRHPNHGLFGFLVMEPDRLPLELVMALVCNCCGTMGYVRAMQYFDNLVISSATLLEPVVAEFMAFSFGVGTLPGLQGWAGNLLVAAGTFAVVYKPAGISGEEGKSLH